MSVAPFLLCVRVWGKQRACVTLRYYEIHGIVITRDCKETLLRITCPCIDASQRCHTRASVECTRLGRTNVGLPCVAA